MPTLDKHERETIYFDAIDSCKGKTIAEMLDMFNGNAFHDDAIRNMINQRAIDLNYTDGTGALYI